MKKTLIAGMMVVCTFSTNISFAAGTAAKSPREVLVDYTARAKESMFGKGGSAAGLSDSAAVTVRKKLIKELNLSGKEASLNTAMSGAEGRARMENLVTIIAAKKMSVELAKTDAVEAKSIEEASNATAKLIANSILIAATKDSAISMKADELSLVRESLTKLDSISGDIILKFSKAERDSYTQVLEKLDLLADSGNKLSYEESFVQAIMEVKKIDRTKALEIVKKLKECV